MAESRMVALDATPGPLEVDLSAVEGTGQGGRVVVGDVEKAAPEDE